MVVFLREAWSKRYFSEQKRMWMIVSVEGLLMREMRWMRGEVRES